MLGNRKAIPAALLSAGVSVCTVLTVTGSGAAAAAVQSIRSDQASAVSDGAGTSGTEPVIIFLKNPPAGTGTSARSGDRSELIQAAQEPYLGQLRQLGATDVTSYRLVDAIAARVPK